MKRWLGVGWEGAAFGQELPFRHPDNQPQDWFFEDCQMKIRHALDSDAAQIAVLMGQLGYTATEDLIRQKIGALASSPMDAVMVAEDEQSLLGVISLHVFELFHQIGRIGRITSLVICENARGRGVGSLLVSEADAFFQRLGCVKAEVTSGDHRLLAHQFYQRQGYVLDERRFVKKFKTLSSA